jgi:exopolysaccharide biosynthesis predicted pyruvyltransferase EpsI
MATDRNFIDELENCRRQLLAAVGDSSDVIFCRAWGNIGDELIYAGARQLLSAISYREIDIRNLYLHEGDTAIIAGSGGWCHAYHAMPEYLREAERRFRRVVVFPSSFEVSVPSVKEALSASPAIVFARERQSYSQICNLCDARLAFDTAFVFDFEPYRVSGRGTLVALRTDSEARSRTVPLQNNDISLTCESMDEWLWKIARSERVLTDRAHVLIAAAMLGKKVRYLPSNYHKVSGIAEYALSGFDVEGMSDSEQASVGIGTVAVPPLSQQATPVTGNASDGEDWRNKVNQASHEIAGIVPSGTAFILIDDDRLGTLPLGGRRSIPFIERAGCYWGPPPDDETAIQEFERIREAGPTFAIFAWPAFWWFDCYPELAAYLRDTFPCIVENERLVAFALSSDAQFAKRKDKSLKSDVSKVSR